MLPIVTDMFIQCRNVRSLAALTHALTWDAVLARRRPAEGD